MHSWQEEQIQLLLDAQTEAGFLNALSQIADELGYDYCAYGMRMPLPLSQPRVIMLSSQPQQWQRHYLDDYYHSVDHEIHDMHSITPYIWSGDEYVGSAKFWRDARTHGLEAGWAQSSHDARGIVGMLTFARSHSHLSFKELRNRALQKSWLAQTAHEAFSRLLVPRFLPEAETQLTTREVEVLRWSADGKTSGEVGNIMCISERTVNFHVNNALVKLGASNKTAGVIKAAILGFL
ncbi:LuxR family transcriptional regulator [Undibacterium terreum]|uniref:LuxR family transcriptional regulator n=2 Tax=Undibacterium terreum TaxID=1224302 RepID=A0A916U3P8_9BURK|nr:LuxR family transcriptional regulator [Undibacterium terreum]